MQPWIPLRAAVVLLVLGGMLHPSGTTALPRAIAAPDASQAAAPAAGRVASRVTVTLPQDDAELEVDGQAIPGDGAQRQFDTRRLPAGSPQTLTFTTTWKPNGYTTMTRSKQVTVRAGEPVNVDLAVESPGDRVRVIYVPTPQDVAEAMVQLAGVTRADVVFEPGCGDARITIAAIRAGAQRAICVDIDPERAEESRKNVEAAGLAKQIDVRLGDALDVKELPEVTVVFLYMGEHFNLLIRPVLLRDLPVGARIVSHQFTMGDWDPERTENVDSSEGGGYILHLWTITEELKRAARAR